MEKISLPVRIFAIVIVLVGLAGMLALRTLGPSDQPVAVPPPARATQTSAKPAPRAVEPVAAVKAPVPLNAPKTDKQAIPPTGFPAAVDTALRRYDVVVVSLVVPGARVDEVTAAEARAGAKLGGAGYVALNVLNEGVARALLTKLGRVEDPSVIVLKRSGEIVLELTGFVDRETVAQAAATASS